VEKIYRPNPSRVRTYDALYARYQKLGDFEQGFTAG
jgi:hypothetical protein